MARKFDDAHRIRFLTDKEDVPYGPENNPKREGSKSAERFAAYRDGMTVKEALEAGITTADITYDTDHAFITVVSD